jgi:hypothetical protein
MIRCTGRARLCYVSHRRHISHVQENDENGSFYAQAELMLAQDVSQAQLELENVNSSVHAAVLVNAKAGRNDLYYP